MKLIFLSDGIYLNVHKAIILTWIIRTMYMLIGDKVMHLILMSLKLSLVNTLSCLENYVLMLDILSLIVTIC